MKPINRVICTIQFLNYFCLVALSQQTISWSLAGNGAWNNPNNWSCTCIPGAMDTALIQHDTVSIPAAFTAAAANLIIGPGPNAGLDIMVGASLTIANTDQKALLVQGELSLLQNSGTLSLRQLDNTGLEVRDSGKVINLATGYIRIGPSVDGECIFMETNGLIDNQGRILIDSSAGPGIIMYDAAFHNKGPLYIFPTTDQAVETEGTFINDDSLVIDFSRPEAFSSDGFSNIGTLTNNANGVIYIDTASNALRNFQTLVNHGQIHLLRSTQVGLLNQVGTNTITNNRLITIIGTGSSAIQNNSSAIFTNNDSIIVSHSRSYGFRAEFSELINNGLIHISTTGNDGMSLMNVNYHGDGDLVINSTDKDGIELIDTDVSLMTGGTIDISNTTERGIFIDYQSTFLTAQGSNLNISNTVGDPFTMDTDEGFFECNGELDIQN